MPQCPLIYGLTNYLIVIRMVKASKVAIVIILATVIVMAAPASAAMFHGQSESVKAEKIVELADKAGQKVDNLIALVYVNETVLEMIETATLLDELEGNVTLFDEGTANVTAAYVALESEDYEGAVANATQALEIFREVFKSINLILYESDVQKGQIIDGQGLLVAIQRALERIERLRELLPEDATEALELLDNATSYLDVDTARLWLLDGKVSETAYNLTQANHLISEAHRYLKAQAEQGNSMRIRNYLRIMERIRGRIRERLELAGIEGIDIDAVAQSLGYENATAFEQALQNMIENAQENMGEIKNAIRNLQEIGQTVREMGTALAQEIGHYRAQHGFGQGNGNMP
jgi:translation initiation factor 2B subunit (eIF-2B alpha/beta/delta family)